MSRRTALALFTTAIAIFHFTEVHAGRPLVVDDAPTVPYRHLEIEVGVSGRHQQSGQSEHGLPDIAAAYGIYPNLEVGMTVRRVDRTGNGEPHAHGFEDIHLTAKYNLIEEKPVFPALAADIAIKVPTASRSKGLSTGKPEESFRTILTKTFGSISAHLNLGYRLVHSPQGEKLKNRIFGGAATEWAFHDDYTFVGEIFGASRPARNETNEVEFQVGIKYALRPFLTFDAAIGRSLRATGTDVQGTLGVTWLYDLTKLLTR
jgi:hypothetical protein